MSSLLSSSERTSFGASFNDLFDTFSRQIIVHKEPLRTITSLNSTPTFGYGEEVLPESVTYTPVSGGYNARIIYRSMDDDTKLQTETKNPRAESYIRVQEDCKNYIFNGKTEKITFDGKTWNIELGYVVRQYIDEKLYEFKLIETY